MGLLSLCKIVSKLTNYGNTTDDDDDDDDDDDGRRQVMVMTR